MNRIKHVLLGCLPLLLLAAVMIIAAGSSKPASGENDFTCAPLMKYPIVDTTYATIQLPVELDKHDLNEDGEPDVVCLYFYSETLGKYIELERKTMKEWSEMLDEFKKEQ